MYPVRFHRIKGFLYPETAFFLRDFAAKGHEAVALANAGSSRWGSGVHGRFSCVPCASALSFDPEFSSPGTNPFNSVPNFRQGEVYVVRR